MSNLLSFVGTKARLGEAVTLPDNGDVLRAPDGTVWKCANGILLPYTSEFSDLAAQYPNMVSNGVALNGPFAGNSWQKWPTKGIVGAANGTWLMMQAPFGAGSFTPSSADFYFTSTDGGVTWTKRTPPLAGKGWVSLWDGTNFVIAATVATTTNGVWESTDGINWTPHTNVSLSTYDIQYGGGLYILLPVNSTSYATSPDRVNWTLRSLPLVASAGGLDAQGFGQGTYNPGAGLWIVPAGGSNTALYMTSPDGITWTQRSYVAGGAGGGAGGSFSPRVASNATTTVAASANGTVSYTVDGINWVDVGVIANTVNALPSMVYWNGTYFVYVLLTGESFYSADGITWLTGPMAPPTLAAGDSNIVFRSPIGHVTPLHRQSLHITNPASAAKNFIVTPTIQIDTPARTYYRIK